MGRDLNAALTVPFIDEEIKMAFFHMHPSKSPGPDGMSPGFYQKHWAIVGQDVCNEVKALLSFGIMLRKINYTHVTLIFKSNPTVMT